MTRKPFIDWFCVEHQYWLFNNTPSRPHFNIHIHDPEWREVIKFHSLKQRLIMFFFRLKAEIGETDLQHNRRVKGKNAAMWRLFDVMGSQQQA